jgi:hypothetical protein
MIHTGIQSASQARVIPKNWPTDAKEILYELIIINDRSSNNHVGFEAIIFMGE